MVKRRSWGCVSGRSRSFPHSRPPKGEVVQARPGNVPISVRVIVTDVRYAAIETTQPATLTSQPVEVTMSLTPNARRRAAFLFGRQMGLRLTSDAFAQLEEKLHAEREQHAFNVAEL